MSVFACVQREVGWAILARQGLDEAGRALTYVELRTPSIPAMHRRAVIIIDAGATGRKCSVGAQ